MRGAERVFALLSPELPGAVTSNHHRAPQLMPTLEPDLTWVFYYCRRCGGFRAVREHDEWARAVFFAQHPCGEDDTASDDDLLAWAKGVLGFDQPAA